MAYRTRKRTTTKPRKTAKPKRSKFTEVERAAFLAGKVERGLKNPNSKIAASFAKGSKPPKKRVAKPLY